MCIFMKCFKNTLNEKQVTIEEEGIFSGTEERFSGSSFPLFHSTGGHGRDPIDDLKKLSTDIWSCKDLLLFFFFFFSSSSSSPPPPSSPSSSSYILIEGVFRIPCLVVAALLVRSNVLRHLYASFTESKTSQSTSELSWSSP